MRWDGDPSPKESLGRERKAGEAWGCARPYLAERQSIFAFKTASDVGDSPPHPPAARTCPGLTRCPGSLFPPGLLIFSLSVTELRESQNCPSAAFGMWHTRGTGDAT